MAMVPASIARAFGVAVPHDEPMRRGWSIFYVAANGDGEAELRCKYRGASGWGADAIVRGVDSFQVLYGVDTDVACRQYSQCCMSTPAASMRWMPRWC